MDNEWCLCKQPCSLLWGNVVFDVNGKFASTKAKQGLQDLVSWGFMKQNCHWKKSGCISLAALLVYLFMMLFAATLVYCVPSLVYIFVSTFSSQFFFTCSFKTMKWGSRDVSASPASLWVTLAGNTGGHEISGIQLCANLLPSCSIWVEEHCSQPLLAAQPLSRRHSVVCLC